MCRHLRSFDEIPVSGSQGEKHREVRLTFVLGFIKAKLGTLDFVESMYDHKGQLTVEVCRDLYKQEYDSAIRAAWSAAGENEDDVEIDDKSACERCSRKHWK